MPPSPSTKAGVASAPSYVFASTCVQVLLIGPEMAEWIWEHLGMELAMGRSHRSILLGYRCWDSSVPSCVCHSSVLIIVSDTESQLICLVRAELREAFSFSVQSVNGFPSSATDIFKGNGWVWFFF